MCNLCSSVLNGLRWINALSYFTLCLHPNAATTATFLLSQMSPRMLQTHAANTSAEEHPAASSSQCFSARLRFFSTPTAALSHSHDLLMSVLTNQLSDFHLCNLSTGSYCEQEEFCNPGARHRVRYSGRAKPIRAYWGHTLQTAPSP